MDIIGYDGWLDKKEGHVVLFFYTHDPVTNGTPWFMVKFFGLDYEKVADEYLADMKKKHKLADNPKGKGFSRDS